MAASSPVTLTIRQGPRLNQVYELKQDMLTIGREAGNDLVIEDAQVSRRHARLTRQGQSYVIEDLGSTNGTFVNGSRVSVPVLLANGDLVGLADTIVLAVQLPYSDAAATLIAPEHAAPTTEPAFKPPVVAHVPASAPAPAPVPQQPVYAPPPPPPPPVYDTVAEYDQAAPPADNRRVMLIGCGCLVLLAIVGLIALVAWSFIDCASFSNIFKFLFPPFVC